MTLGCDAAEAADSMDMVRLRRRDLGAISARSRHDLGAISARSRRDLGLAWFDERMSSDSEEPGAVMNVHSRSSAEKSMRSPPRCWWMKTARIVHDP